MNRLLALLIFAVLLFVGCAQPSPPDEGQPSSTDAATSTGTTSRTSTSAPTQQSTPALPLEAFLTGCTKWATVTGGPTELFGGPLPPGWEPQSSPVFQLMQFHECERLAWGPFERGPLRLVFEFSEDFIAPDECTHGDFGRAHILRALWVNDAEVGAWLASTYGMPIRIAEINVEKVGDGATLETWTWSEGQDPPSEMRFQYSLLGNELSDYRHRLYWFDQDSTSYMDFSDTYTIDDNAAPASVGLLQEPTIYASWSGANEYAALADHGIDQDTAVSIAVFDDFQCSLS